MGKRHFFINIDFNSYFQLSDRPLAPQDDCGCNAHDRSEVHYLIRSYYLLLLIIYYSYSYFSVKMCRF